MGDWTDRDELLTDITYSYNDTYEARYSAQYWWNVAKSNFDINPSVLLSTWGAQLFESVQYIIDAIEYLYLFNSDYEPAFGVPYFLTNYAGGTIDMDAIIEAMWDSDKLRWFHFINYIDAMRAGIWNTEIYDSKLAEWYIHFSEQSSL
jgi:hypothetical protein